MKITEAIGVRGENLSSEHGAEGKTMRNLFGVHGENLSSRHGAGGKTMRNLFGIRKENLSSKNGAGGKTMRNLFGTGKEHLKSDEGERTMSKALGMRWLVVAAGAAMLLVLGAACTKEIEVPGETIIVEKEIIKTVEVPGETIVVEKEVVKTVEVPGETIVVEKVVEKEVIKTVAGPERVVVREVPGGKTYVTDPSTGKTVEAPRYGGSLRLGWNREPKGTDPSIAGGWAGFILSGVAQKLAAGDWAIDRDEFAYLTDFLPVPVLKGQLAESWETPDPLTIIFNIRKGVNWHDKPPMNGREFIADDVVFNFQRLTGTGDFSGPAGYYEHMTDLPWESITATDKWTVVFKLKEPVFGVLLSIIDHHMVYILPPEVIEEHGDVNDWRNVVGTGPYMLTDWVEGGSISWEKNPNYWGYDEKYPQNRLPYIDETRALVMPDEATRLAALRTAKVDYVGVGSQSPIMTIDAAESLRRTNPELQVEAWWQRSNASFATNVTEPPFDDIRVRHAMQMALDIETIANTFLKGYARTTPMGIVGRPGYYIPFEEWPEEVKQYYRYDPEGAEKLLDEAGYPRGADGIRFKTTQDLLYLKEYPLIAEEYWREIGVHVTSYQQDAPTYDARFADQSYGGMTWWLGAAPSDPMQLLNYSVSGHWGNRHGTSDPAFDAMYEAAEAAPTEEEQTRLIREMDMYYIEQHWTIWGPITPLFGAVQPWVKGWSGETKLGAMAYTNSLFSRLWIDSELKEAMGH